MDGGRPRRPPPTCLSYSSKRNPGNTGVPSLRTASRLLGSRPNSFRIVGATCVVSTNVVILRACRFGFDTSSITLVSSCAKPPCSACFFRLPV